MTEAKATGGYNYSSASPTNHPIVYRAAKARAKTYKFQRALRLPRHPYPGRSLWNPSYGFRVWLMHAWRHRAHEAQYEWRYRTRGLRCIHTYEGAWNAYNSAGPYYGGMQMDWSFMDTWGHHLLVTKGDARHWTPFEQLRVAYHAYLHTGYGPWPNTARDCGLL